MRIHSLRTLDFGPHRKREDDIDAAVVGLLGPNGSGKSTLLNAIQFAITGELRDPLESYIRGRGVNWEDLLKVVESSDGASTIESVAPDIAKAAQVEMVFSMHGQRGKITRRITPTTSTRVLEWDGEVIKKSADVDAALKDIVGADKKAISEIVFPAQGELDNLLFGRQSEREDLFIKLLLLTHMSRVADLADSKARLIKSELAHLDSQKDQLSELINEQTKSVFEAEEEFRKCASWAPELVLYRHIKALDRDIRDLSSRLTDESNRVSELEIILSAVLRRVTADHNQKPVVVTQAEEISALLEAAEKDRAIMVSTRDQQLAAKSAADQRGILEAQLQQSKATLAELQAELDALEAGNKAASEAGRTSAQLQQMIETLERASRLRDDLDRTTTALAEAKREVEAAEARLPAAEADVKDLTAAIGKAVDDGALARVQHEALKAHLEHGGGKGACPVCEGDLGVVDEARVQKALEILEIHRRGYADINGRLQSAQGVLHHLQMTIKNRGADAEDLEKRLDMINTGLAAVPQGDLNQLRHEKTQLEAKDYRRKQILDSGHITMLQENIASAQARFAELQSAGAFNDGVLSSATSAIQSIDNYCSQVRAISTEAVQVISQLNTTRRSMADNSTRLAQKQDERAGYMNQRPEKLVELMSTQGDQAESIMEVRTQAYTAGESRLAAERGQLTTLKAKMQHIEERERADAQRAAVADQLIQIKEAFQRRGLPITYVQYRFNQLVELANRNLLALDANFSIQSDPKEMVSLTFRRTDDASDSIYAMNKLSGGQRVRLSIAFLLAIQQLIIPDLGLLVLDEPSMHLNADGVESLADLLQGLGQQLVSADAQVIVCDHNHLLNRAFQKTIILS